MAFCENCGKEISDQAVSCPNCGHPRGIAQTAVPMGAGLIYPTGQRAAEWWKRLVAIFIDSIIIGIPSWIVAAILGAGAQTGSFDPVTGQYNAPGGGLFFGLGFGMFLLLSALPYVYYAVMNGSDRGQTVGKMVMKIQVRDIDTGGPIGIGRGFIRGLIPSVISAFTCGILGLVDGLWPLWDSQRQALHDKMARSVVVDVQ